MMCRMLLAVFVLSCALPGQASSIAQLDPALREARLTQDFAAVARYRDGLQRLIHFAATRDELFPREKTKDPAILPSAAREEARKLWQSLLDYQLALDSLRRYHQDFAKLRDQEQRQRALLVGYGAFAAQYRSALDFLALTDKNPQLDVLLNEALPELGLPAKSFANFKYRYLHVARAVEFAAMNTLYRASPGKVEPSARAAIQEDAQQIFRAGRGKGEAMTVKNGFAIVRDTGFEAIFPVQAGVSEWMGDTKVYRKSRSLISASQIQSIAAKLEPGDILLERREWYVSNIGLPGFWPHGALYIGTAAEREKYFEEAEVAVWVRGQGEASGALDALLRRDYPAAYQLSAAPQSHDHVPRVLEAISEGVSFTTIEHSLDADSIAVLRPRLSKREKAIALHRAFAYSGRPYDFNFDFRSDASLVCTELIYKAYEAVPGSGGLRFPLVEIAGRIATPANEMVKQFDAQYGGPAQQSDLIVFLDGDEKAGVAREAPLAEFLRSWRRPKWHILMGKSAETTPLATR